MKFKSNIEIQAGLEDASGSPGAVNQLLSSTVTGTAWIDPSTIVAEAATLVVIACKNTSGAAIAQGTPVYQTGTVGATATIEIAPADALISANKLPAIGLLQTALNNNGFGFVVITGELTNFTTSPIDGVVPTTGDKVFVKSGGGLTLTKPTGEGNGIQNMGLVGKVSGGNSGSITVSSIMRTNDVPNLPEGRIWIGDGNTIVSDTVYVDEPNNRVGVGTTSPNAKLEVVGTTGVIIDSGSNSAALLTLKGDASSYGGGGQINIIGGSQDYLYYATNIKRSPGTFEAKESYDMFAHTWAWDGNMGNTTPQPYTSYDFKSQGSSQMVIYNNNVGIGTTSPSQKLHVLGSGYFQNGNVFVGSTSNSMFNYISTFVILAGGGQTIALGGGPGNVNNNVLIGNGNLSVSGNVGIGTTSPGDKLVVQGDGDGILVRSNDFTLSRIIPRGQTSTNWDKALFSLYNAAAENVRIDTAGSSWFNGGNVGIGTTSPSSKLQVNGGVQLANDTAVASASKVGTFRYRTSGNNSHVDMCMQTGASTYAWVNIVTNNW